MSKLNVRIFLEQKWWFRWIRGYNWFSFRYWWFNYSLWILFLAMLIWLLSKLDFTPSQCEKFDDFSKKVKEVENNLNKCCNCRIDIPEIDSVETSDTSEVHDEIDRLRDSLGGCVGEITVTLSWKTYDDLDLHLQEPDGTTIFYGNKRSRNGGVLDIDMNAGGRKSSNPIENICYKNTPPSGKYKIMVHFYKRKTEIDRIPYMVYVKVGNSIKSFKAEHSNQNDMHFIYEFNYPE